MIIKRLVAFLMTVIILLGIVVTTTPGILKDINLGLDLKGGFEILYEAEPLVEGGTVTRESLRQTARSLEQRADAFGVSEPQITPEGENRIRARIAGVANESEVREIMRKPAELTFRGPDGTHELIGSDFAEGQAQVVYNEFQQPIVQIQVKDPAKLRAVSEKLFGQQLAIYLDEEELSAPYVRGIFTDGRATIDGSFTIQEARELADVINLGALPLKLTELYTQSVGATLGQQSLDQTVRAGLIASVFILLFMITLYRVPGIISSITLIVYTWGLLLLFDWMNATLTLPGIAAFILGIGMAVDANIITAERIKEELRSGKSLLSSLRAGSKNSFRAILDANVTTILAGVVLYFIGTGAIQGFALTLILSILLSMVTNVFLSRLLLQLLISSNWIRKPQYVGVNPDTIQKLDSYSPEANLKYNYDYVGKSRLFFIISGAITVAGILSLLLFNMNLGVDFKAGTSMDIEVGQATTVEQVDELLAAAGVEPSSRVIGGDNNSRVSLRFDQVLSAEAGQIDAVLDQFRGVFGEAVSAEENTVDPGIAQELGLKAIIAVLIASLGIIVLVSIRFEWRFALAAVVALLHDAFLVISVFSIFQLEVNLPFVAAVLTIVGYSINDTIVVFDRIRENLRFAKLKTYEDIKKLVNLSIAQTLVRSINTGLTVLVASILLFMFGSSSIQLFSLAITIGLAFGMYSSIFIAAQLWVLLKKKSLEQQTAKIEAGAANEG